MIIYKATNKKNGKVYIGQTIKSLERRRYTHYYYASKDEKFHFQNALLKYDESDFVWEVLCECSSKEEMDEKEKYYIELYDTYRNGYNMTFGGEGSIGRPCTEETRQKLRDNWSNGGYKHPEWMKKKMSEDAIGRKNNFYGKSHTEETKQNIRDKVIGDKSVCAKEYLITTPNGEEIQIKGLVQFCREHGLDQGTMTKVSQGKHRHHKGYKCRKLE